MENHENKKPEEKPAFREKLINTKLLEKKLESISENPIVILLLVAIIGASVFQTYELLQLKQGGSPQSIQQTQAATPVQAVPASLQNLPDMVGGC